VAVGVHASTIALNWMIEHHIIYTISGAITGRRGPLLHPGTGKVTSHLNGEGRSSPPGVVR
jgi:hypothetical protein